MTDRYTTPRYPTERRERAVRMELDHAGEYPSRWAAMESVAAKFGCVAQTLHNWVARAGRDAGKRAGLPTDVNASY